MIGRARGVWGNSRRIKVREDNIGRFRVSTANVDSLNNNRQHEVVEMLARQAVDICAVTEVGAGDDWVGMVEGRNSQYKLFRKGELKDKNRGDGKGGVGFLVASKWENNVRDCREVLNCDRIMSIRLEIGGKFLVIFCVYAPQQGLANSVKDRFYEQLRSEVSKISSRDILLVVGDLNGHVGRKTPLGYKGIHGGFGYGKDRNDGGNRILEFCASMDMFICNTCFKKRDSRLITYCKGGSKSQIDFCLARRADRYRIKDARVIGGEPCLPSHKLLVCDVGLEVGREDMHRVREAPKLRVWRLRDPEVEKAYRVALSSAGSSRDSSQSEGEVEVLWEGFKSRILGAADKVLGWTSGRSKHKFKYWWDASVDEAIASRKIEYGKWKRGEISRERFRVAEHRAKEAIYMAKSRSEDAIREECLRDGNYAFRLARQMSGESRVVTGEPSILNDAGDLATTTVGKLEAWREHYNRLMNEEFNWDRDGLEDVKVKLGPPVWIEREWVVRALSKMKKGKAAGPSGIVAEMLLAGGDFVVDVIWELANAIVRERSVPREWGSSIIVSCFKGKGSAQVPGNYRGLKLLDQCMKVFERIIEWLIRDMVDIDDMQYGFRQGRSTTDAIFVVRQLQEKYLAKNKQLFFAFVDLEKAFDRVPREVVWWAMRSLGVDEWLVSVVQAMYVDARSKVRVQGVFSEEFPVRVGVHQGSVLSPLLFIMVMEAVSRGFSKGSPWELLYADDLAVIAESMEELEGRLGAWKDKLERKGLRVNMNKTKVMISGKGLGTILDSGKFPCAVCRKGVGMGSICCTSCDTWVHGRKACSGINRVTESLSHSFVCKRCRGDARPITNLPVSEVSVEGAPIEVVDRFCYLGDTIGADGGASDSVGARIRVGWNRFRVLKPILTSRSLPLQIKGLVYASSVRSAMIYSSQTWPIKKGDEDRLVRNEMDMVRWMCGVRIADRIPSVQLRERLGIEGVREVIEMGRLRWFGHVSRMNESLGVSRAYNMRVEGDACAGRPRMTWRGVVGEDLRRRDLSGEEALDRGVWRGRLRR